MDDRVAAFRQMHLDGTLAAWCDRRLDELFADADTAKRQLADAMTGDEIRDAEENVAARIARPMPPPRPRPAPRNRVAVNIAELFPDLVGGVGRDALYPSRDPHPQPETRAS